MHVIRRTLIAVAGGLAIAAGVLSTSLVTASPAEASSLNWQMTGGNIQSISKLGSQASVLMQHYFNKSSAYGFGSSLVRTPILRGYGTTPVLQYTSLADFTSDVNAHRIKFGYKWVMYDPEQWTKTPDSEQVNPIKAMNAFGALAHSHGYKVIMAPALDLGGVKGTDYPRHQSETNDQWFVRINLAGAVAKASDIFTFQDESNETKGGQYAYMFNRVEAQLHAVNPSSLMYSTVSSLNGTETQMLSAANSISPVGFYVAVVGNFPPTIAFYQAMMNEGK